MHAGVFERRFAGFHLRAGALDRRPVGVHSLAEGVGIGLYLLGLVLGNNPLLEQFRVAGGLGLKVAQLRGVPGEVRFGLAQQSLVARVIGLELVGGCLQRPLVDFKKRVAFVNEIALIEEHLHQLPAGLCLHADRGFHVAYYFDVDGHVALRHAGNGDRHGRVPASLARGRRAFSGTTLAEQDHKQQASQNGPTACGTTMRSYGIFRSRHK